MPSNWKKRSALFAFGLLHGFILGWFFTRQSSKEFVSARDQTCYECPEPLPEENLGEEGEDGYDDEEALPEDDHLSI